MTTYKSIFGKPVKFLSTDPDNAEAEGQIWYNSTSGSFKSVVAGEAWSSGGPLITGRQQATSTGTQDAGLFISGYVNPGTFTNTEEYNGSGWSNGGAVNTARRTATSFGSQTAAIFALGTTSVSPPVGPTGGTTAAESYNGTSWTSVTAANTARWGLIGFGTQTAGVVALGNTPPGHVTATEEYNGSSWTSVNSANNARELAGGAGIQTAGLVYGGQSTPSSPTLTEEYDGTSWTSVTSLNNARVGPGSAGTQTSALASGGSVPILVSESYDGISWTDGASIATGRGFVMGAGTGTAAFIAGGQPTPSSPTITEEYNKSINVITAAAWASGGTMNTARVYIGNAGTQTAGLGFGGYAATGATGATEEYNGSTWSNNPTGLGTAKYQMGAFGTQTAAVSASGTPGSLSGITQEYDGSTWTTVPATLSVGRYALNGCGILTAGLVSGGDGGPPTYSSSTEEYDGTTWTGGGNLVRSPSSTYEMIVTGTQTAALAAGGYDGSGPTGETTKVDEYNGSAWTSVSQLIDESSTAGGAGIQTDSLLFGGTLISAVNTTQGYDGTAWSTRPSLATARFGLGGAGSASLALAFGGSVPPFSAATEEFTGETSALNFKTLTTS